MEHHGLVSVMYRWYPVDTIKIESKWYFAGWVYLNILHYQTRHLRYFLWNIVQKMTILLPAFIVFVWIHTLVKSNFKWDKCNKRGALTWWNFQSYGWYFIIQIQQNLCLNIHNLITTECLMVFTHFRQYSPQFWVIFYSPEWIIHCLWQVIKLSLPCFSKWQNLSNFPSLYECQ